MALSRQFRPAGPLRSFPESCVDSDLESSLSPDGRRERITGNIVVAPPEGLDQADRKTCYGYPDRDAGVTVTRGEFDQNNPLAPRRHQTKKAHLS